MNASTPESTFDNAAAESPTQTLSSAVERSVARHARDKGEREDQKLEKRLCRQVGQAIVDYNMIEAGDRVMVCVSGGKDSYSMLDILRKLQARAPVKFELIAVNLDQKQPGFPADVLPRYLSEQGVPFHIETQNTYSVVKAHIPEGKTMCSLCSRMRRGILYRVAKELGATKIALGHHRDDILQTTLLNMFFGSRLKGMPPKLVSDSGEHIIIRPMAYVCEADLTRWATLQQYPIIPCTLCGSQENLQRKQMSAMLQDWEKRFPGRVQNMFTALANVVPSHLMDRQLHPFESLKATGRPDKDGDKAFDDDSAEGCDAGTSPTAGATEDSARAVQWLQRLTPGKNLADKNWGLALPLTEDAV
jgi:tRNA 2-thiocytidine biosynthesis protein TtcA